MTLFPQFPLSPHVPPSRILLISLSNIGDAVLTTPVLEALHRQWPSAQITVLVGPRAVALFERDPRVARVRPYQGVRSVGSFVRWVLALRRERFDLVVDLRHSLLPLALGARRRTPLLPRRDGGHRTTAHLAVIQRLGVPVEGAAPRVWVAPEDEVVVADWLAVAPSEQPLLVVAPGSRSHLKRWPAERFAGVCDALIAGQGARVVVVGDGEDAPIAQSLIRAMRHPALDLAGRTTLRQLAALVRRARLVLTNDNAVLHLAGAMATPVVAVFGPTDPVKYGPTGPGDAVVRLGLVCSPCERALCPYGHECLQWLPAREVLAAARAVLKGREA